MHARSIRLVRGAATAVLMSGAALSVAALTAAPAGATGSAVTLFASPTGTSLTCLTSASPCSVGKAATRADIQLPGDAVTIKLSKGTYDGVSVDITSNSAASIDIEGTGTGGPTAATLDGTATHQVLIVTGSHPVSVSDIEITHGKATTGGCVYDGGTLTMTQVVVTHCTATGTGGGILIRTSGATATLSHVSITANHARTGAGVYDAKSTLHVTASTIGTNAATGCGGGVYNAPTNPHVVSFTDDTISGNSSSRGGGFTNRTHASMALTDDTISGNTALTATTTGDGYGGGVTSIGTTTLTDDTISGNKAVYAGGMYNGGTSTVTDVTVSGNSATTTGGGILNTYSPTPMVLTDSTITGNSAKHGAGVFDGGGATVTMVDDTLADDAAKTAGGGLYVSTTGAKVTVSDSIFDNAGCVSHGGGKITDGGYNVASTHTCTTAATDTSTSTTIDLLPLAANTSTGPQTLAVPPKSSAFEKVPAAACTVTTDERGEPRPGAPGQNCDAGAYEYQLTGYDLVGSDGGVFVFNPPGVHTKGFYGSLPGIGVTPYKPVVGIVPTVTDSGYFLVAADGGVFAFGNAPFLGSLPGSKVTPNLPIVGIVAADTDKGYFLVGADGGVYAFGTVPFSGSLPGKGLSVANVIGIAATPSGKGYWVVQSTGTVTAFGTAQSFTTRATTSPVTAIAGTPTGGGYWLVTKEGGVYPYGNAAKQGLGTLPAIPVVPNLPVIGIVRVAATVGYWMIGEDGGVFAFGTAPFVGSLPGLGVHVTDIAGAVPT